MEMEQVGIGNLNEHTWERVKAVKHAIRLAKYTWGGFPGLPRIASYNRIDFGRPVDWPPFVVVRCGVIGVSMTMDGPSPHTHTQSIEPRRRWTKMSPAIVHRRTSSSSSIQTKSRILGFFYSFPPSRFSWALVLGPQIKYPWIYIDFNQNQASLALTLTQSWINQNVFNTIHHWFEEGRKGRSAREYWILGKTFPESSSLEWIIDLTTIARTRTK